MSKKKTSTSNALKWLDEHGLALLAGFLMVFIPLYPKLPLADIIPGYIVRLRLEDFFILFTSCFWLVQWFRGKARIHPIMTKLIIIYLIIGFLSTLSALFITQTVPLHPLHYIKLYLHYFRRIEYFALFFILFSAIQNRNHVKYLVYSIIGTLSAISIYGFGQKYLYWPVYSTMNREFSKGITLYLTEHARVPSTFGGHYDAAAYIMIVATIILAIVLLVKDNRIKILGLISYALGFWTLILTASRTSFIAYLAAISAVMVVALTVKSWRWGLPRGAIVISLSIIVMLSFGDLSERYTQALGLDKVSDRVSEIFTFPVIEKPEDYLTVEDIFDEETAKVASKTDQQPTTEKPSRPTDSSGRPLPGDVYVDVPVTVDEIDEDGQPTGRQIKESRTYSENAHKYGLSMAIRLDTLWPQAIDGFLRNPLLGSGYSTLTKESVEVFTEAESTDNDFLRTLGETGLLGFLSFFAIVGYSLKESFQGIKRSTSKLHQGYLIGFIAATFGLLLNAIYIDVFVASKVATTFWALTGLALAIVHLDSKTKPLTLKPMRKKNK